MLEVSIFRLLLRRLRVSEEEAPQTLSRFPTYTPLTSRGAHKNPLLFFAAIKASVFCSTRRPPFFLLLPLYTLPRAPFAVYLWELHCGCGGEWRRRIFCCLRSSDLLLVLILGHFRCRDTLRHRSLLPHRALGRDRYCCCCCRCCCCRLLGSPRGPIPLCSPRRSLLLFCDPPFMLQYSPCARA